MSASDSEQSSVPQEYTKTRVEKAQKAKSKAVHSSKLSAKQRLRQGNNSEHFYVDGDTLFCKTCAVSIDYSRQSCLEQHLKTQLHEKNAKSEVPAKKQKTLTTTLPVENTAKLAKLKVVTDYVRVLVSTKTLLHLWNLKKNLISPYLVLTTYHQENSYYIVRKPKVHFRKNQ